MEYAIIPAFRYQLSSEGTRPEREKVFAVFDLAVRWYKAADVLLRPMGGLGRPDMVRYTTSGLVAWDTESVICKWAGLPAGTPLHTRRGLDPEFITTEASLDLLILARLRDDGLDIGTTWVEVHTGHAMALVTEILASGDIWRTNVFDVGILPWGEVQGAPPGSARRRHATAV